MRKIFLISHGDSCVGMKNSLEMILGEQSNVLTLSLLSSVSAVDFYNQLKSLINQENSDNDEILIMADLKGGTPANTAFLLMKEYTNIKLITGFHLALVIQACLTNEEPQQLIQETNNMIQEINNEVK